MHYFKLQKLDFKQLIDDMTFNKIRIQLKILSNVTLLKIRLGVT